MILFFSQNYLVTSLYYYHIIKHSIPSKMNYNFIEYDVTVRRYLSCWICLLFGFINCKKFQGNDDLHLK